MLIDRLVKAFKQLRHDEKVENQTDFGDKLRYSKAYISRVLNGKEEITDELLNRISTKFKINPAYIKGESEDIYQEDTSVKASTPKEIIPLGKHLPIKGDMSDWQGLPMYNVPITASFVESYRDDNFYVPQYYLYDPRFRDCDFGAIITGDSMHSEIRHGDFVPCKEITNREFIVFGEIYYVVATNGLETCKYLNAHPTDPDCYLLVPKNDKISPSPLPKHMIRKLYRVRGIIRGY